MLGSLLIGDDASAHSEMIIMSIGSLRLKRSRVIAELLNQYHSPLAGYRTHCQYKDVGSESHQT